MTAHKHAAMIKAKVDNMDLTVLCSEDGEWRYGNFQDLCDLDALDCFLCLPQHKEACLHWLNGGSVEFLDVGGDWHWYGCSKWSASGIRWMSKDATIRIKPRKEKRWLGVFQERCEVNGNLFWKNTERSYESVDELKRRVCAPNGFDGWQFFEIEVEV